MAHLSFSLFPVHFFTYDREFITQYCQVSALLELESLLSQQSLREAFSDAELSTAKQRHQQIQDYIQVRRAGARWEGDGLDTARGTWPGQSHPGRTAGASAAGLLAAVRGFDPIQQLLTALITLINPDWRAGGSCSAGPHLTRKGPGSAFSMDVRKSTPRPPLPNTPACSSQALRNPRCRWLRQHLAP